MSYPYDPYNLKVFKAKKSAAPKPAVKPKQPKKKKVAKS